MKIKELATKQIEPMAEVTEFFCGCEFEIESVHSVHVNGDWYGPKHFSSDQPSWDENTNFGFVADHSLRNNGIEVLTSPANFEGVLHLFERLHTTKDIIKYNKADAFSARTSIHVHVNVLPWTLEQAKQFVMLYALFEPYFFSFSPGRKNNIHCVPLNYTIMPNNYYNNFHSLVKNWSKYTAFNLLPVVKHGTIEFRHMHGHADAALFEAWITALKKLWDFVNTKPPNYYVKHLMAGKSTAELFVEVFGFNPTQDFYSSTIDVKLGLV